MDYALVISGSPSSSQAAQTAYGFASALLAGSHRISRIFLYGEGVYLASSLITVPRDEEDWSRRWSELIAEHDLPATACIASALRRGIVDEDEAQRHEKPAANLAPGWTLAGLGDWVEAELQADRVIYFNASY